MTQGDNILSFKTDQRRITLDEKSRLAVAECRRAMERTLPKLIGGLFEKLDDALYELADKSDSNQLHSTFFDAMRVVRLDRSRVEKRFLQGVFSDFDQFWQHGPRSLAAEEPSGPMDGELDLSLVDDDELEESLAVSNLVSKGENRYQRELHVLNRRLAHLAGAAEMESQSNPLGPAAICNGFRHSIRDLMVETPVRLVIYKLFDKQVMHYIGGLYEELNTLLSRAGVMPKFSPRVRREQPGITRPEPRDRDGYDADPAPGPEMGHARMPSAGAGRRQAPQTTAPGYAGGHLSDGGEIQAGLFNTLQDLIGVYRVNQGFQAPRHAAGVPEVGTAELLGALSHLQQVTLSYIRQTGAPGAGRVELRDRLSDELKLNEEGESGRALEKTDEDTLDVIAMLFDFVLADPNLPDAMKALIARLQIPMLKVAIVDKSFFSRKLHPARRLLNNLAQAAVGWSDDGDRSENSLYGHVEAIVDRVMTEFKDDPALFETLDREFSAYMEREQRGAEMAEERTNQVTRGKEQLRVAKNLVSEEIDRRLSQEPPLPEVARELLADGWKDVLLLTYLRQGPDSDGWRKNLELADRLVWSVQPKRQYAERQELLHGIPDLLRNLREGLNSISYDQHNTARLFKELQSCHIACLRGIPGERPATGTRKTATQPPRQRPETGARAGQATREVQHDRFTELAETLAIGTWLELQEEDERRVRLKLSWKSDVSDAYVFVNRKGVKVREMTAVGIAKLLRQGTAEILSDVETPIMDRALEAMVSTLQSGEGEG